jgi:hypothetical protein
MSLDEISKKWKLSSRGRKLRMWARPNKEYRQNEIGKAMKEKSISSKDKVAEWIKSELPNFVREIKNEDKSKHMICAIIIEETLIKHPKVLGALCKLGDATQDSTTDFVRWRELSTPAERLLVEALEQVFALA